MHRIDTTTAQKDKFGPGKNGFTNGDTTTGVKATALNAEMWDAIQEELCNAIEKFGLTLDGADNTQLYQVISKAIDGLGDYLAIENNLSEIAAGGTAEQTQARENIGALAIAGGDVGYLDNSAHYSIKAGTWEGVGPFDTQYNNPTAPFLIPYGFMSPQDVSNYLPIIKGLAQTASYGFGTAVSFGAYTTGAMSFANAAINVTCDDGSSLTWFFDAGDGSFGSPGGISAKGPIYEEGQRVYSPNNPQPGLATTDWVNATFVTAMGLGAQFAATRNGDEAFADAGCVISGIGDFGADDGYGYQRPSQYCINGQWYTSNALAETLPNSTLQNVELSDEYPESLTELTNLTLYTPEVSIHPDVYHLVSSEGYDFYAARGLINGEYIIGYDPESFIIRLIALSAERIWPINMSIVAVDSIPDGCSMDGTWIYSDGVISQSIDAVIAKNKSQLRKRLTAASAYIVMYQSCADLGAAQEGDDEKLNALKEYVIALRAVDLTQSHPAWPPRPEIIS